MIDPNDDSHSQQLRTLLEQLHRELTANPPTDERNRQLLLELQQDIERAIPHVTPPSNLRGRLQDAIAGFEGSHPQTTAVLERVLVLLSNFGL